MTSRSATSKRLAQDAYQPDAFKPNLTSAEADVHIAMLKAKLKLLGEPPHTLIVQQRLVHCHCIATWARSYYH